jgi:hypothetical protein
VFSAVRWETLRSGALGLSTVRPQNAVFPPVMDEKRPHCTNRGRRAQVFCPPYAAFPLESSIYSVSATSACQTPALRFLPLAEQSHSGSRHQSSPSSLHTGPVPHFVASATREVDHERA